MKRILVITLAFMLCLSLFACGGEEAPSGGDGTTQGNADTTAPVTTDPSATDPGNTTTGGNNVTDPPYVSSGVVEHFYSSALITELKSMMTTAPQGFLAYSGGSAPYMVQDSDVITKGRVLSVSLPIVETKKPNSNGDFTLSFFVVNNTKTGMANSPVRTITVKVNATEHGLTPEKTELHWITLDLTSYNINLAENQSLALFSSIDTLIPAYTETATIKALIDAHTANGTGFFSKVGSSGWGISNKGALIYDVEIERTYTADSDEYRAIQAEKEAFEQIVAALSQKYAGKTVSVLGDSISTFGGVSNDTSINSTIGYNDIYYNGTDGGMLSAVEHTYWGHLINRLNLELCVNNGYSASRVFGKSNESYGSGANTISTPWADSAVGRADQLHRDNGTASTADDVNPDVILFYMGINDINNNVTFGTLLDELANTDPQLREVYLRAWVNNLINTTKNVEIPQQSGLITNFQQAYAMTLYRMTQAYPNAEIYCLNLMPCIKYYQNNGGTDAVMKQYNEFIALMADYFGATVVDQYKDSELQFDSTVHYYTNNNTAEYLHPNAGGHQKMAEHIIRVMAKKNGLA